MLQSMGLSNVLGFRSLLLLLLLNVNGVDAGERGPGNYAGNVVFDRWDGCSLVSGAYVTYVSNEVKARLREYAGSSVVVNATDVYQPKNPGDALIQRISEVKSSPSPPDWLSLRGLKLGLRSDRVATAKTLIQIILQNDGEESIDLFSSELAPVLFARSSSNRAGPFPVESPSFAIATRQSFWSGNMPRVVSDLWTVREGLTETFRLKPSEQRIIEMEFKLPDGQYQLFAAYGGGVHEYRGLISNSLAIDINAKGETSIYDVSTYRSPIHPYSKDSQHLWNRLFSALVGPQLGEDANVLLLNPFLKQQYTVLIEGRRHQEAIAVLDEFLKGAHDQSPLDRLMLQRELWAAFDLLARFPDENSQLSEQEAAVVALRIKLAKAIGHIALTTDEVHQLPSNFLTSTQAMLFSDPGNWPPEQLALMNEYLDASGGLLNDDGTWIPIREANPAEHRLIAQEHAAAVDGRAAFAILLRLPAGRAATLAYLRELTADRIVELPAGTQVALVRFALAIDQEHHVRVTSIVESVQFRTVIASTASPRESPDMQPLELVLDRSNPYFSTTGSLRVVNANEKAIPFDAQSEQLVRDHHRKNVDTPLRQLQSCVCCHPGNGIKSVLSLQRGLEKSLRVMNDQRQPVALRTFDPSTLAIESKGAVSNKTNRYDWGLLRGLLEGALR